MIDAVVRGLPRPQGSKRVVGGRLLEANEEVLRPWRNSITAEVHSAIPQGWVSEGAFMVEAVFAFPALKKHAKKPAHWKVTAPDIDKLLRAVLDAVTDAGAWGDDSQVVEVRAAKVYADEACLRLRITRKG